MLKRFLSWLAFALAAVAAGTAALYVRDMRRAYDRIRGKSTIVSSPFGDIEFAQGGVGPTAPAIGRHRSCSPDCTPHTVR